jgi:valyl-tRNA synthetase
MWDEYCSWYIEMTKPRLTDSGGERATAQQVLVFVLDRLLRMLHPIVPFVTEAIWEELGNVAPVRGLREPKQAEPMLVTAAWPTPEPGLRDDTAEKEMQSLQAIIRSLRDIRSDVNDYRGRAKAPSIRSLPSATIRADDMVCKLVDRYRDFIRPLAGCDLLEVGPNAAKPAGAMSRIEGSIQVYAPVGTLVDLAEVKRAELVKLEALRAAKSREEARLGSGDFVKRADPSVVEQARQRVADLAGQILLVETHIAEIP